MANEKEKCCTQGTVEFDTIKELSEYLKVVADANRLQILCLLNKGERCVCNIHEPLGLPQNLTSHHLKALREAGLVNARREGKWIYYSVNEEKVTLLSGLYRQIIQGGSDGDQDTGHWLCELQEARGEC